MCYSLIGSCLATCCCSAFGSAFGEANPFMGHLLIFFVTCVFAMVAKFILEKNIEWPYTSTDVCNTDACAGNGAVFRTSFGLTCFFATHALLLMVPGCKIFHGFAMFLKFCLLCALIVGCFWIDNDFFEGYGDFARVGSAFWLIIQTMMLVAWGLDLNDGIIARGTNDDGEPNNSYYYFLCFFVLVFFGLEIAGCALAVDYFGGDGCHRNNTFVAFTIILTFISYVAGGYAGAVGLQGSILSSAIICFYTTYLLMTGLYSDPNQSCNSQYHKDNDAYVWVGIVISTTVLCYGAMSFQRTAMINDDLADIEAANKKKKKENKSTLLDQAEDDAEERHKKEDELEEAREEAEDRAEASSVIPWNYVKFHIAMTLASLYVCMLFTGWGQLSDTSNAFKHSNVTVWVNILTQWATFAFYLWSIVFPLCCPDRFEDATA